MPRDPITIPEGETLPDTLAIPDGLIDELEAEARMSEPGSWTEKSAVARLKFLQGSNEQAVRARIRANRLIALAQAGYTRRQIAKLLGLKPNTVKVALWRARSSKRLNDLRDMLENDTSALAVDTVNHHLRKHDKDVAIEHLKGMGFYKNHSNVKNEGGSGFTMPPLTVNVLVKNDLGAAPVTPETFDTSEMCVGVPREDS
jgi:predicted transcriptional regulator